MKVLITGARGFIGRRLLASLPDAFTAAEFFGDVRAIGGLQSPADVVVHLGARTMESLFQSDPFESFDVNVTGTLGVLDFCRRQNAHLVFASTSGVYAANSSHTDCKESSPLNPARLYPVSKAIAERACMHYAAALGVRVTILRLFNVYGPGQSLPYLVPDIMDALLHNRPLSVRMPDAVRDFVHVDDVVSAILAAVETPPDVCRIVNIGSGIPLRVLEVVQEAERASGRKIVLASGVNITGEVSRMVADISKAGDELGWKPSIGLASGLKATWHATASNEIRSTT